MELTDQMDLDRGKRPVKRLLLINPVGRRSGYLLSNVSTFQPLGLAYIAAVTPSRWEVKIVDENMGAFAFEEADLVGITSFTSSINRAYEIARMYREKKIKVIMGGIHSSMLPDEALRYADTVVTGEAEGIWPQVIEDFENNRLLPKYDGPRIDLSRAQITPRRDLLHPDYLWNSVQTSRGCPFSCNFCSVSRYLGRDYRQRGAADVLRELQEITGTYIAFVDDNLIGHDAESRNRAIELFEGMISRGLNKKWWMQTSINAADDEQVIRLAAQAGCMFVFIGFETLNKNNLQDMKKSVNLKIGVENYNKAVDRFHKYGIGIFGSFIIGNDYESPEYYSALADYLVTSGIDIVQISILTPLPGTDLMEQLQNEGRLKYEDLPADWDRYRLSYVVHQPRGMDENAVYDGNNKIKNKIYSFPSYQYRLFLSMVHIKNLSNVYAAYRLNRALKKSWQGTHYYRRQGAESCD